jgi:hypothetical protein
MKIYDRRGRVSPVRDPRARASGEREEGKCATTRVRRFLPFGVGGSRRVPACRAGPPGVATVATCAFRPLFRIPCASSSSFHLPALSCLSSSAAGLRLDSNLSTSGCFSCPHHIPTRYALSARPGCLHVANVWVNSFSVMNSSRFYSTSLLCANSRFALAFASAHFSFPALGCPWSQRTPLGCITDIDEHPLTRPCGPPAISYLVFPSQLLSHPLAPARTQVFVLQCLFLHCECDVDVVDHTGRRRYVFHRAPDLLAHHGLHHRSHLVYVFVISTLAQLCKRHAAVSRGPDALVLADEDVGVRHLHFSIARSRLLLKLPSYPLPLRVSHGRRHATGTHHSHIRLMGLCDLHM